MPNSEYLKMIELLQKLRSDILEIEGKISAPLFKQANVDLQEIYKLHLSSSKTFTEVEDFLKNLYRSFNYAAAIVTDALKRKSLKNENAVILEEAFETMIKCCDVITAKLKNSK